MKCIKVCHYRQTFTSNILMVFTPSPLLPINNNFFYVGVIELYFCKYFNLNLNRLQDVLNTFSV